MRCCAELLLLLLHRLLALLLPTSLKTLQPTAWHQVRPDGHMHARISQGVPAAVCMPAGHAIHLHSSCTVLM
jgi:hypothetical protein